MKKFFITTAIDYVNNLPHLGTAYEKIGADALVRYLRMGGNDVHFQMGNDEHSTNVKKEAIRRGLSPKKYCDQMRKGFESIWKSLNISYDDFIQTSEERHTMAVPLFIENLEKGDIYKKRYEGWYCESCEAFYIEKDLLNGECPNHKQRPTWLSEENYFFKLSKYQSKLLAHYEKYPNFILPEVRRNEVLNFVKGGLQDISISREGLDWGIPFPGDPSHVVYVWFDALINYLSATEFFQKPKKKSALPGWPAHLHIIGKDITRFHCVIWPAMLMSVGLPLPRTVFGHGFVFLKGEKMSKTLGNIVTPLEIVPRYGADALRYYLLRESSFGSDGDFTWENFIKRYNSDLANDLGNLLNRTLGMANKYLDGRISKPRGKKASAEGRLIRDTIASSLQKIGREMDYRKTGDINFHLALAAIWEVIAATDKYIDTTAPWKLAKEEKTAEINRVLYGAVDSLRNIALLIAPFLPESSQKIWEQLGLKGKLKWERQTFKNVQWAKTPSLKVKAGRPIFPRIEPSPTAEGREMRAPLPQGGEGPLREEKKMEIDITEFQKLDLRVAEVKEAERVEGTDKLLKLQVNLGGESRQIVAGIAQYYKPDDLVGKSVIIVANLKPATIRGVESRGMLLAASNSEVLSIVTLDRPVPPGAKVK